MKTFRFLILIVFALGVNVVKAQNADTVLLQTVVDSVVVANDTLKPNADSLLVKVHKPIAPVRTLGEVAAIDTLPTTSEELQIILFNDNTWRYVRTKPSQKDEKIFSENWNTSTTHVYYGITPEQLPESIAIELIDSLSGHHYPYKGYMSSKYGPRGGRGHQGVDLPLKTGDAIYATFDGKVRYSEYSASGYGNLVVIRHNNGLETYYAHLSERMVEAGDWVVAGQQIGKGGSTGRSSGPHLHFETRYKGQSFDPERLFDFQTGELRRRDILLKRRHFSIYAKYEQNFTDEEEAAKQAAAEKAAAAKSPSTAQYHTIKSGDTFGHLAAKYKTTSKRIQELNPKIDPKKIQIGQKIRVR
jgi:murein DD-endopeptidase MepM/ murein hydrolase activator NlpD